MVKNPFVLRDEALIEAYTYFDQFIRLIKAGKYSGYSVKMIKGQPTPVSKRDGRKKNNLG